MAKWARARTALPSRLASSSSPPSALPTRIRRARPAAEFALPTASSARDPIWPTGWPERPKRSELATTSDEEAQSAQHQARLRRWRRWPLYGMGLVAFSMGLYGVMLWTAWTGDDQAKPLPSDLSDRFDAGADEYDDKVDLSERWLFLASQRKRLAEKASGHVLEVAAGTGRNLAYYNSQQCATVTLVDCSGPMLAVAKRKWSDRHKDRLTRLVFQQQSALDAIAPPDGAPEGYDTVVQTMGLCSTPEPVKLLQNMAACVREDGQILLLEHGQSHYRWLNRLLDKTARAHADQHGCWWNKDIGAIVEESGLEVVDLQRHHLGTTWWLVLRPPKGLRRRVDEQTAVKPWWPR